MSAHATSKQQTPGFSEFRGELQRPRISGRLQCNLQPQNIFCWEKMIKWKTFQCMLQSVVSLFLRNCSGEMELMRSKLVNTKTRKDPVGYFYSNLQLPASRLLFGSMFHVSSDRISTLPLTHRAYNKQKENDTGCLECFSLYEDFYKLTMNSFSVVARSIFCPSYFCVWWCFQISTFCWIYLVCWTLRMN